MTGIYNFHRGTTPLLISIPHDGRALMPGQPGLMTDAGLAIPDTDWHVRQLYAFAADMGASVISANYSRYVVDLNRPADDTSLYPGQMSTGLCPLQTFSGEDLYEETGAITGEERVRRARTYWHPYHDKIESTLTKLKDEFGHALLWDAHSIRGVVPALFDGELPDLNFGTNDGSSCAASLSDTVAGLAAATTWTTVVDGRFKGGYITRHYGDPADNVHAIQLELAQRTYMDEASTVYDEQRARPLQDTLRHLLQAFTGAARA
mgnify:CR=1 FL=1